MFSAAVRFRVAALATGFSRPASTSAIWRVFQTAWMSTNTFFLIYDARDVAPYRQNDTSRVLERLRLDYCRRKPTKRSSALSSHMHTSTVGNNHPSDCGHHAFERGCTSSFPPFPFYSTQQTVTQDRTGHPRSRGTPCLNCIKNSKETGRPTQLKTARR